MWITVVKLEIIHAKRGDWATGIPVLTSISRNTFLDEPQFTK
jgi:hypothetical protein